MPQENVELCVSSPRRTLQAQSRRGWPLLAPNVVTYPFPERPGPSEY
jgi:hypothetical protein